MTTIDIQPLAGLQTLKELIERNEELKSRVDVCSEQVQSDEGLCEDLVSQIMEFLEKLRPHASNIASTADYDAISRIASEWQVLLSSVLHRPIDVRQLLTLPLPPSNLRPSPRPISGQEVFRSLQCQADDIARKRKLTGLIRQVNQLNRQVSQLTKSPDLIHANLISNIQEMQRDFYDACLLLGVKVLTGTIRVSDQLETGAFEFLEGIWLNDVKRLMAYLAWEQAGEPFGTPEDRAFYLTACEPLHKKLFDPNHKAPEGSFDRIRSWIECRYLTDGQFRPQSCEAARELVQRKAWRIWSWTGRDDCNANWLAAERFARGYYGNIVQAIHNKSSAAGAAVLDAFQTAGSEFRSTELVNALEAAIVLEFLPAETARLCCRPGHDYVV